MAELFNLEYKQFTDASIFAESGDQFTYEMFYYPTSIPAAGGVPTITVPTAPFPRTD